MNKNTYIKFGIILLIVGLLSLGLALLLFNNTEETKTDINKTNEVIDTTNEEVKIVNSYYDYSKFDMSNTFYTYKDDNYTSSIGIDVSEHNLSIDWDKVKESGIEFVYLRIGWRGYTEGGIYLDTKYYEYLNGLKDKGFKVGVYFFSQAISTDEAKQEAQFVLDTLADTQIDLPIVYDFENITGDEARTDNLTKEEITNNALAFFEVIKNANKDVMLYGNKYILDTYYDMDKLKDYKLWYAQYHDEPETELEFSIWQYSDSAKIDGIEKETDLNIMMIKK